MEREFLMNGSKVIVIKQLFSKAVDLFKADMYNFVEVRQTQTCLFENK
jgi:hypothetical protein